VYLFSSFNFSDQRIWKITVI